MAFRKKLLVGFSWGRGWECFYEHEVRNKNTPAVAGSPAPRINSGGRFSCRNGGGVVTCVTDLFLETSQHSVTSY